MYLLYYIYKTYKICKLQAAYANGENCVKILRMFIQNVVYVSSKSKSTVKVFVHITPVFSC